MKAITRNAYGGPEVLSLQTIERPAPKDREVLVRVYASTVSRTDCGILRAKPFPVRFVTGLFRPSSPVPGTDFAGEVVEVGSKVGSFKPGDRVWGFDDSGLGSHAEYMTISEKKAVISIPESLSYDEVVACAEGAHYAYNFINKIKLKAGDKVLVNGATGAIGSAALQLLKCLGASVTAVGNTENIALLQDLGADRILDYRKEDFTQDKEKYHFIFDTVGKSTFVKCKPLLLPGGVYISSELGPHAQNVYLPLITKFTGNKRVIFPVPFNCKRSLLFISSLVDKGAFRPVIDRKYPAEKIKEAYEFVESGQKTGSVVVGF